MNWSCSHHRSKTAANLTFGWDACWPRRSATCTGGPKLSDVVRLYPRDDKALDTLAAVFANPVDRRRWPERAVGLYSQIARRATKPVTWTRGGGSAQGAHRLPAIRSLGAHGTRADQRGRLAILTVFCASVWRRRAPTRKRSKSCSSGSVGRTSLTTSPRRCASTRKLWLLSQRGSRIARVAALYLELRISANC